MSVRVSNSLPPHRSHSAPTSARVRHFETVTPALRLKLRHKPANRANEIDARMLVKPSEIRTFWTSDEGDGFGITPVRSGVRAPHRPLPSPYYFGKYRKG